jgi:hypothetical protein
MARKIEEKRAETVNAAPSADVPTAIRLAVDVLASEVERARVFLHRRLRMAICEAPHAAEVGLISGIMSDLRALDDIRPDRAEPIKAPAPAESPQVAAQKAAASNDVLMRAQNAAVARKEANQAAREDA